MKVTTRGVNLSAIRTQPSVRIPLPPSANKLFKTVAGHRAKSREYKAWLKDVAGALLTLQGPASYPCRFHWAFGGAGINESRDGDNLLKPLLDVCVAAGVIPGDCLRYVRGWRGEYQPHAGEPGVKIWFETMPGTEEV